MRPRLQITDRGMAILASAALLLIWGTWREQQLARHTPQPGANRRPLGVQTAQQRRQRRWFGLYPSESPWPQRRLCHGDVLLLRGSQEVRFQRMTCECQG